jgi:hypothetical protein
MCRSLTCASLAQVSDALADAYAAELLQPEAEPDDAWSHKVLSYAFADAASQRDASACLGAISLRCSANLLAGSTGCASWEAGLALAEAALSRPDVYACRSVLELGAGAGCASVALARAAPALLRCTDGSAAALANLRHNLEANDVEIGQRDADEAWPDLAECSETQPGGEQEGVACAVLAWEVRSQLRQAPALLDRLGRLTSLLLARRRSRRRRRQRWRPTWWSEPT